MIQTLRKYEQGAGLKPIPVIILSVKQEKKMRDLMFFEGVAGYVEKPFEAANLLKKIREAISTS
jgi:CheY-like chemotaxis protein